MCVIPCVSECVCVLCGSISVHSVFLVRMWPHMCADTPLCVRCVVANSAAVLQIVLKGMKARAEVGLCVCIVSSLFAVVVCTVCALSVSVHCGPYMCVVHVRGPMCVRTPCVVHVCVVVCVCSYTSLCACVVANSATGLQIVLKGMKARAEVGHLCVSRVCIVRVCALCVWSLCVCAVWLSAVRLCGCKQCGCVVHVCVCGRMCVLTHPSVCVWSQKMRLCCRLC
jgi:hypothetical protein